MTSWKYAQEKALYVPILLQLFLVVQFWQVISFQSLLYGLDSKSRVPDWLSRAEQNVGATPTEKGYLGLTTSDGLVLESQKEVIVWGI